MPVGHPVFWVLFAAVVAPLLPALPMRLKIPVVVLEVLLGILFGPHALGFVEFDGFIAMMFPYAMATTLFMAGMELDFQKIRGRPLGLALGGWAVSLLVGVAAVGLLHVIPKVDAPFMVVLVLCTTGLGVLIAVFRDGGQLETPFGRLCLAAGTIGEIGPVVAMSLLLSRQYSTWQEFGFLLAFLLIVGIAIAVGMGARPPALLAFLGRQMHASSQLPVRLSFLLLAAMFVLAEKFGFESIFGAFAAGLVIGQITRGEDGDPLRHKIDAVSFGWFYPFFFVGTGIKFNIAALGHDLATMLLVPTFLALFLLIRGAPVMLYRNDIEKVQRLPFALSLAVPSLSIIVVITEIGERARVMNPDVAAALVGAALLSVMVFPTLASALLSRGRAKAGSHTGDA
jgi:Kef-type K+ transport system membrane component KefB